MACPIWSKINLSTHVGARVKTIAGEDLDGFHGTLLWIISLMMVVVSYCVINNITVSHIHSSLLCTCLVERKREIWCKMNIWYLSSVPLTTNICHDYWEGKLSHGPSNWIVGQLRRGTILTIQTDSVWSSTCDHTNANISSRAKLKEESESGTMHCGHKDDHSAEGVVPWDQPWHTTAGREETVVTREECDN